MLRLIKKIQVKYKMADLSNQSVTVFTSNVAEDIGSIFVFNIQKCCNVTKYCIYLKYFTGVFTFNTTLYFYFN